MHAGVEFTLAAVVGLASGGLLGWAAVGAPGGPTVGPSGGPVGAEAPPAAAVQAAPPVSAGDCQTGPHPDAALRERRAEVDQLWAFELARLERREGRAMPWPDDPAAAPEAVETAVVSWSESHGLAVEALDCAEYPCIAWVAAPGVGTPSREALVAALVDGPGSALTVIPLEDGRVSATLEFGTPAARRARRTRWRERSLRGVE